MNITTAPEYLPRDTYAGRWTMRSNKPRSDIYMAAELAAFAVDGVLVIWEHAGLLNGVALYVRTRFVPEADGSLVGYDSDGARKIIHPAERKIRIMTR